MTMKLRRKHSALLIISIILAFSLLCGIVASGAALLLFETQYSYDKSNPSWLTKISVYEDMSSLSALINGFIDPAVLVPMPKGYEYSHTHESFVEELELYMRMYSLNELSLDSQSSMYIFLMQQLNVISDGYTSVSDEKIREMLEDGGIVYPSAKEINDDTYVFARALYLGLTQTTENFKMPEIPEGTSVEQAFVIYLDATFGKNLGISLSGDSANAVETLQEYLIESGKFLLKSQGYTVPADASDDEVTRLLAIMVIHAQGIAVDEDKATFEEIKIKYLASMLGIIYHVSLNPDMLNTAIENGNIPFYMLQAMGQEKHLTVRSDLSYEEAFMLVAENTDYFQLENKFHADIQEYATNLEYKRDKIWIMTRALNSTDAAKGQTVTITIDGKAAEDGKAHEIILDKTKASQQVDIRVAYTDSSGTVSSTYKITFYQGDHEPPVKESSKNNNNSNSATGTEQDTTNAADSSGSADSLLNGISTTFLPQINSVFAMLVPSFNESIAVSGFDYIGVLNNFTSSGSVEKGDDGTLGGVGGIDISASSYDPTEPLFVSTNTSAPQAYKHIDEIETAPYGYDYVTDSRGYVIGLSQSSDVAVSGQAVVPALAASITVSEMIKNAIKQYLWVFVIFIISLVGIAVGIIWKALARSLKNKKDEISD